MARIHIDKIVASGSKGESCIEFAKNLTIIMGKSETGKTTIYKCIDYLFGAKKDDAHRPFLVSTGYDTVIGYFTTDYGYLKVTRKIDETKIYVETDIPDIDTSKPYTVTTTRPRWIGQVWKIALGIPADFKIPYSKDGKTRSFSWRSINQAFMIHEKRVSSTESIITAKENTNVTGFFSELLYLLYLEDLSEYDAEEGEEIRKIRRAAVQKYISAKRLEVQELVKKLEEKKPQGVDIETLIDELREKLYQVRASVSKAIQDTQEKSREIFALNEKIKEIQAAIEKYDVLESQYTADIKRLGLIADGEAKKSTLVQTKKCPFCEGVIAGHSQTSYISAAKGELNKIINNLNELSIAKQDLVKELSDLIAQRDALQHEIDEIKALTDETLTPEQTSIEQQLREYQLIVEYNRTLAIYDEMDSTYAVDFESNGKPDAVVDYHPKDIFKNQHDFAERMVEYYRAILEAIGFSTIDTIEFDYKAFDIIVNNNPKANRSKGYSCLLNSVMVLALREYMNRHGAVNPHFYFFDSPIQTLMTATNDEDLPDDLRKGFLNYIFNNYGDDQIIIIENTDQHELPSVEAFDENKVRIYEFTKNRTHGRYGFLNGVFQN